MALRGWSYADLSDVTGIHRSTFSKMWAHGGHCRHQTKSRIVRALIEHPRAPREVLEVAGVREPGA